MIRRLRDMTAHGICLRAGHSGDDSDRNIKDNIALVDRTDVLARLMAVPVTSWNYKSEGSAVRHIGPMAQDFHVAFGVGQDDRHIHALDANGVALAAIQALNAKLEAENAELKQRLSNIENRLAI